MVPEKPPEFEPVDGQAAVPASGTALSARTEKAEDELARFFAQSLDPLCVAGLDGYFKRLNPAWTNRLGLSSEGGTGLLTVR